jgi:hypothetical protein
MPTPPTEQEKYDAIKAIMHNNPGTGFKAHYHGPSTPGNAHPQYFVVPGLLGTNAAGRKKLLGYKYHGSPNGDGWHCFLVDDFDDLPDPDNGNTPNVGAVDENMQNCIKNIDHT